MMRKLKVEARDGNQQSRKTVRNKPNQGYPQKQMGIYGINNCLFVNLKSK